MKKVLQLVHCGQNSRIMIIPFPVLNWLLLLLNPFKTWVSAHHRLALLMSLCDLWYFCTHHQVSIYQTTLTRILWMHMFIHVPYYVVSLSKKLLLHCSVLVCCRDAFKQDLSRIACSTMKETIISLYKTTATPACYQGEVWFCCSIDNKD